MKYKNQISLILGVLVVFLFGAYLICSYENKNITDIHISPKTTLSLPSKILENSSVAYDKNTLSILNSKNKTVLGINTLLRDTFSDDPDSSFDMREWPLHLLGTPPPKSTFSKELLSEMAKIRNVIVTAEKSSVSRIDKSEIIDIANGTIYVMYNDVSTNVYVVGQSKDKIIFIQFLHFVNIKEVETIIKGITINE